jgi:hypothetical protein
MTVRFAQQLEASCALCPSYELTGLLDGPYEFVCVDCALDQQHPRQPVYFVDPPATCDICEQSLGAAFIDGRTVHGPWANMCEPCFAKHGVGIGQGRGQLFHRQADDRFMKVA